MRKASLAWRYAARIGSRQTCLALIERTVLYAVLTAVGLLAVVPLLWAVAGSFTPLEKVFLHAYPFSWRAFLPADPTLEAYAGVLRRGFSRALLNSLLLGCASVGLGTVICAMAGFAFGHFRFRGKTALFGLVLFTFMIPFDITVIPLYILINQLNWINTWQALILPNIAHSLVIFMFRQFFADFPQDLIDAAQIDGASWLTILFRIIVPSSVPVLISAGLVLFLNQWDAFFWPLLVAPSPDLRVVQIAIASAVREHFTIWNELFAGSLLAAAVPLLLVLPLQRYYVRGVMSAAVKE